MLPALALLISLISPANATDRTEFTCSPLCQVVVGTDHGPAGSVRITEPYFVEKFPSFTVTMDYNESMLNVLLVYEKKVTPVWISDGAGGERDRVWYGTLGGPSFAEIDAAELRGPDLVHIRASDGETWSGILWTPSTGQMLFEDQILHVEPDPIPEAVIFHRSTRSPGQPSR